MKQPRLGTTGFTQKEAIFQIVKKISGSLYQPGVPMKPVLWEKADPNYGRSRRANCPFDAIVEAVYEGLSNGSIPSKLDSDYERRKYASRIVHYSLRHDKRLNGGLSNTRTVKKKKLSIQDLLKNDRAIKAMNSLMSNHLSSEDQAEIQSFIVGRMFTLILEANDIDFESIPENVRDELKMFSLASPVVHANRPKKVAA